LKKNKESSENSKKLLLKKKNNKKENYWPKALNRKLRINLMKQNLSPKKSYNSKKHKNRQLIETKQPLQT
jgi:hypothetical protein